MGLLTVAKVSEILGLPCYIDYKTALNKISDNNINLILTLNLEDEILHKNLINLLLI